MQRRAFIIQLSSAVGAALLAACGSGPTITDADVATARRRIDVGYDAALLRLRASVPGLGPVIDRARGILLFPTVVTGGPHNGDAYGEGVLRVANAMLDYYSIQSSAVGQPSGMAGRVVTLLFLFMAQDVLDKFLVSDAWRIGIDAPVATWQALQLDRGNTELAASPILSLAFGPKGIVPDQDLDLHGMAITPLQP